MSPVPAGGASGRGQVLTGRVRAALVPLAVIVAILVPLAGRSLPAAPAGGAAAATPLAPLPPGTPESFRQMLGDIYSDFYGTQRQAVDRLLRAGLPEDDISVICLVAATTSASVNGVAVLRLQGFSWTGIFEQLSVPAGVLAPRTHAHVPAERFARPLAVIAADPERPARLPDQHVRDLAQLRVAVEYYGLDPSAVATWREQGIPNSRILLSQHLAAGGRLLGRRLDPSRRAGAVPGR